MKKTYPVIDNKYVVDKEARGNMGYNYNTVSQKVEKLPYAYDRYCFEGMSCYSLLATIGEENRIQGLPVIVFEEDWKVACYKVFPHLAKLDKDFIRHTEDGFMEGFKDRASKGRWTDEEVLKLLEQIDRLGLTTTPHSRGWSVSKLEPIKELMQSFKQPQITEIELEVEDNGHEVDMEGRGGSDIGWMPKIELKITKPNSNGGTIII